MAAAIIIKPTGIARLRSVDLRHPINRHHPLAQGLVGFWKALPNTVGGSTLHDLSGHKDHAALIGMTPSSDWIVTGHGHAVYMGTEGSDERITGGASTRWWGGNLTVSVFARPRNVTNYRAFVSINDETGAPPFLMRSNNANMQIYGAGGSINRTTTTSPVVVDEWALFSAVLDDLNNQLYFYKNGFLDSSWSLSYALPSSSDYVMIGAWTSSSTPTIQNELDGEISSVIIHNRELSASEEAALYIESLQHYPTLLIDRAASRTIFTAGAGGSTYEDALTLAAILTQAQVADAQAEAALTLAAILTQAEVADITAEAALSLAAVLAQAGVSTAQAEAALTLATDHSLTLAGGLLLNSALTLAVDHGHTHTGGLLLESALSLGVDAGLSPQAQAAADPSLVLSVTTALTELATATAEALQSLQTIQAQSPGADAQAETALSLGHSQTHTMNGGLLLESVLTLALDAGLAASEAVTIDQALTLAVTAGMAETSSLTAVASLTLAHTVAMALTLEAIAGAGLTLSHIHTHATASQLITTATAPDSRTYVVTVDTRTFAVTAVDRTLYT